jgi:hypothetical protein
MYWGTIEFAYGGVAFVSAGGLHAVLAPLLPPEHTLMAGADGPVFSLLKSVLNRYAEFINLAREHFQNLLGLAGLSFGVWRWWRYREAALFRRLDEYLDREQSRLRHARAELFESVLRPSVGRMVDAPFMSMPPLERALRAWGWLPAFSFVGSYGIATDRLTDTAVHLQEQKVLREREHLQLNQTFAAAQLLRGALEGARAARASAPSEKRHAARNAIAHFEDALRLPGNEHDLDARELKLYQLILIGEFDTAEAVCTNLLDTIRLLPPSRERSIRQARALKCAALIERKRGRNRNVNGLCGDALQELSLHTPLLRHELLDAAELHEMQACARALLGYAVAAEASRDAAQTAYTDLANAMSRTSLFGRLGIVLRRWLGRENAEDALYRAAQTGLQRLN